MSRFSYCPASYAMGHCGCGAIRVEDATRIVRLLYTPARIALVAAFLGAALFLALQFANPSPFFSGTETASRFAMPVSSSDDANREVDQQTQQLLAEFEQRYGGEDDSATGPRP